MEQGIPHFVLSPGITRLEQVLLGRVSSGNPMAKIRFRNPKVFKGCIFFARESHKKRGFMDCFLSFGCCLPNQPENLQTMWNTVELEMTQNSKTQVKPSLPRGPVCLPSSSTWCRGSLRIPSSTASSPRG